MEEAMDIIYFLNSHFNCDFSSRVFTKEGQDPFNTVEWEKRDVSIKNDTTGKVIFQAKDLDFPATWDQTSAQIVAEKYFRYVEQEDGSKVRETSVRQMINRVVETLIKWGAATGYFSKGEFGGFKSPIDPSKDALNLDVFRDELKYMLLHQMFAFNSPVWFNIGTTQDGFRTEQMSACFLGSISDNMESILENSKIEGLVFKGGSGYGVNYSKLRASMEPLSNGGTSSGPVPFMIKDDMNAGAIKCVTGDTKIWTDRGLLPIAQVVPGDSVATGKGMSEVSEIHKNTPKKTKTIKLGHTSLKVTGTGNHPIRVVEGGILSWKNIEEIDVNDYVVVSRNHWSGRGCPELPAVRTPIRVVKPCKIPVELNPDFSFLLGAFVADGCYDEYSLRYTDGDKTVVEKFVETWKKVFESEPSVIYSEEKNAWTVATHQVSIIDLFSKLVERGADNKRVPKLIFEAGKDVARAFLRGYFSCDGHAGRDITASSASKLLRDDVQDMLFALGMKASCGEVVVNEKTYYIIRVSGESARHFYNTIGFDKPLSEEAENLLKSKQNTNTDIFPNLVNVLREYLDDKDANQRKYVKDIVGKSFFNRRTGNVSLSWLRDNPNVVSLFKNILPEVGSSIEEVLEYNYFIDTVSDAYEDKIAETFDITVPGVHSFVGNGIVCHNSGGSTRRSARMVVLDIDHPDIEEFVKSKQVVEKASKALVQAGFAQDFRDRWGAYALVPLQNGNQSVMLTDDFMDAVEKDKDWNLIARVDGSVIKTVKARYLWDMLIEAAWHCADPGVQFKDTINNKHQTPNTGPVTTSNPCLRKNTKVRTRLEGDNFYDKKIQDINPGDQVWTGKRWAKVIVPFDNGVNDVYLCKTEHGELELTKTHNVLQNGKKVPVSDATHIDFFTSDGRTIQSKIESLTFLCKDEVYDLHVDAEEHSYLCGNGFIVSNCSEFFHIDWASCNLASINVLKVRSSGRQLSDLLPFITTAMNIFIDGAGFPHDNFRKATKLVRPIGIGLTNLGAYLMSEGLAYDSDEGRKLASQCYDEVNTSAWAQSCYLAAVDQPFPEYHKNKGAFLNLVKEQLSYQPLERHTDILCKCLEKYGAKNSHVTNQAPVGTISFLMGCQTTGIEPELSLIKYKKLVGGNTIKLVNSTVSSALQNLGYSPVEIKSIEDYVLNNNSVVGSVLKDKHYNVFDTSFPEPVSGRSIEPMGHVKMMAAAQPFISSAISKTVNLPNSATKEDISHVYMQAWKLGLKSIAIYRDGCKSSQPMEAAKKNDEKKEEKKTVIENSVTGTAIFREPSSTPVSSSLVNRKKLPDDCVSIRHKFSIGGHEGYLHVGLFDDGSPGELFINMSKEGSTIAGLMDALGVVVSMSLQYGVPLSALVDKFSHTKFEPSGFTSNANLRTASSVIDYIFRWMEQRFILSSASAVAIPQVEPAPAPQKALASSKKASYTGEACSLCGGMMQRTGACNTCSSCGVTGGCG